MAAAVHSAFNVGARVGIAFATLAAAFGGFACQRAAERASARELEEAVSVRAVAEHMEVRPGAQVRIAVALLHRPGFHSWPNVPVVPSELEGVRPIATSIEVVAVPDGTVVGAVMWPEPSAVTVHYTGSPVALLSYVDTIVAYVPLTLPDEMPAGEVVVILQARFQTCDDRYCYSPRTVKLHVPLHVRVTTGMLHGGGEGDSHEASE